MLYVFSNQVQIQRQVTSNRVREKVHKIDTQMVEDFGTLRGDIGHGDRSITYFTYTF